MALNILREIGFMVCDVSLSMSDVVVLACERRGGRDDIAKIFYNSYFIRNLGGMGVCMEM